MGEKKKGNGGETADDVERKAMRWLLTTREAYRLVAARDEARKAFDDTTAEAKRLADELVETLRVKSTIETHRIFLPSDANIDATIVEVTTGVAIPTVQAHAADFVAGG